MRVIHSESLSHVEQIRVLEALGTRLLIPSEARIVLIGRLALFRTYGRRLRFASGRALWRPALVWARSRVA